MTTAKQNQKFPFHFLSAPPTPPPEENKKGKENFWFLLPRPKGADEARIIGRQDSIQNTFELCSIHTARKDFASASCPPPPPPPRPGRAAFFFFFDIKY